MTQLPERIDELYEIHVLLINIRNQYFDKWLLRALCKNFIDDLESAIDLIEEKLYILEKNLRDEKIPPLRDEEFGKLLLKVIDSSCNPKNQSEMPKD